MSSCSVVAKGRVSLRRSYRFSAAHCYRRPEWSSSQNWEQFGRCSLEPGHGHNYRLTVELTGPIDPQTGFLISLSELDRWVSEAVLEHLDHRHLNHHVERFQYGREIPTCENLVLWIVEQLTRVLPANVGLVRVAVDEDESLGAVWETTAALEGERP